MKLTGWGNFPVIESTGYRFETSGVLRRLMAELPEFIPYGMGRSYGDSALNDRVILSERYDKMIDFDPETGILICESGVSLSEIIRCFLPRGWFLSVTPGTRFISLGGAVAADVHGKNHHTAGCFSRCVVHFDLMLPDGRILLCSREENPELFRATCGGMGLTGVILSVAIRLQKVTSSDIDETIVRCRNLEEIFDCFETHTEIPYSVAWIDCLARNEQLGRSIFMAGRHSLTGNAEFPSRPSVSMPVHLPGFCLNRYSISLFNELYFRKSPTREEHRTVSLHSFFYPLDAIDHWNRMYGKKGFTQYQLVLPKASGRKGMRAVLERIAASGCGSFLAVLKLLGPENDNPLSFPLEGYTLALDFRIEKRLFPLLEELDEIMLDHGGRLYPAKDVRMKKRVFRKGYPEWERFVKIRERYGCRDKIHSLQSKRLGI